jgi:hypothetical protein
MKETPNRFEPLYPDVLGAVTGGKRITLDSLQMAMGIFPKMTYIDQPVEAIVLLQNMIDQPMQIRVGVQLPSTDKKGNPVVIDTPKKVITLGLRPGEVGVLYIPITPNPPTQAGNGFPVRVAVRYRAPEDGKPVRAPMGGAPPSVLTISSFKLQALQEVDFNAHPWNESAEVMTSYFDIAPKRNPIVNRDLEPRFESIWTMEEWGEEVEMMQTQVEEARRVASGLTRNVSYWALLESVEERFAERGLPLHPGEVKAIAKMMTYTVDEGMELEAGFKQEESRWFQTLCQVMAANPDIANGDRGELINKYLFDAALYDAVILGFATIDPKVKEELGDEAERINYANRVLQWMAGQLDADLSYVYLPLVMGGIVVNLLVNNRGDNPWIMVDELNEATRGRKRLVSGEMATVFKMVDALLAQAEDNLRRARVIRPEL